MIAIKHQIRKLMADDQVKKAEAQARAESTDIPEMNVGPSDGRPGAVHLVSTTLFCELADDVVIAVPACILIFAAGPHLPSTGANPHNGTRPDIRTGFELLPVKNTL